MQFGEKIRELREEKKLNQTEFGKIFNITQRKISYIENGDTEPSLEEIRAFCKYFNVSADYLLDLPKDLPYPEI